jgi:hypothetical protein
LIFGNLLPFVPHPALFKLVANRGSVHASSHVPGKQRLVSRGRLRAGIVDLNRVLCVFQKVS